MGALTGVRFGLDADVFNRWRAALSDEEQEGFIYYGGDMALAKFVCAFDYQTHHHRKPQPQAIVAAYSAAYGVEPDSWTCRTRAFEAFDHPAVQYLLESFATANLKTVKERSLPPFSRLLNKVLEGGNAAETLAEQVRALDAGTRFLRLMQTEGKERRRRTVVLDQPVQATSKAKMLDAGLVDAARNASEEEPEAE